MHYLVAFDLRFVKLDFPPGHIFSSQWIFILSVAIHQHPKTSDFLVFFEIAIACGTEIKKDKHEKPNKCFK